MRRNIPLALKKPGLIFLLVTALSGLPGPARSQAAGGDQPPSWTGYRTIMWIGGTVWEKPEKFPLFLQRLREMGINTAMVHNDGDPRPFIDAKFPFYVENMVNKGLCLKWNSNVRDWDGFVTKWAKSGRPDSALVRDYCLDDPKWLGWASGEMQRLVRKNMTGLPVAYDIRDELSTTISANPFDYDFNPLTLQKFREWLKTQYAGLDALNAEWDTKFATWDEVKPFTTDQIKNRMASGAAMPQGKPDWQAVERMKFNPVTASNNRTQWNFAPWCDFRTYMDVSLANALGGIRKAAHEIDPRTPVGIEGEQAASAFGGHDLWRLSQAVDWVEPYDIGNSREIFGSFMPGKPIVATMGENGANRAARRFWHLLLEGDRGCIVWWSEDCIDWKSDDCALTPKALALAPVLKEMTSPLAQLFLRAKPVFDPIAIHYSQASIQVDWLLESTVDGSTWLRRFSSFESGHNRMMKVRDCWLKALQDLGYTPQFVSSEQIERGALASYHTLVLPDSFSLSASETSAMTQFTRGGGVILCNGTPGCFDEHGKLIGISMFMTDMQSLSNECVYVWNQLNPPRFSREGVVNADGASPLDSRDGDIAIYASGRLAKQPDFAWAKWISVVNNMRHEVTVPLESRTRIHRYKLGAARLVAFERNVDYHMGEDLKQAGGNETLEIPVDLEAKLDKPAHVYDLRTQKYLGLTDKITFTLDPWRPSLYALLPDQIPAEKLMDFLSAQ